MKLISLLFYVGLGLLVLGLLWIRLAPSAAAEWHVAPNVAANPGLTGVRLVAEQAPVFVVPPDRLMDALRTVAENQPRVRVLAKTSDPLRTTFIVRSRGFGFPDYATYEAIEINGGTRLEVLSRLRFGGSDWGVNSARVDVWLDAVREALRQDL